MDSLVELFKENLKVHTVKDDFSGHVEIHFGEVENNKVNDYHKEIEIALKAHAPKGDASILTTQGKKTSLLSVLFYPCDIDSEYFLNINYI